MDPRRGCRNDLARNHNKNGKSRSGCLKNI